VIKKLVLISSSVLLFSANSYAQEYVPGEVIVKMRNTGNSASTHRFRQKAEAENGMELKQAFKEMKVYHYKIGEQDSVESAISNLEQDPDVEFVEPNYIVHKATAFDNNVEKVSPEQIEHMKDNELKAEADAAGLPILNSGRDSYNNRNVNKKVGTLSAYVPVVAVIDTGLDINHDVFVDSGAIWVNSAEVAGNGIDDDGNGYIDDVNGWNYITNSGFMHDDEGHGTHVSGIVLKAGMDIFTEPYEASPMKIMPLKFLDHTGSGSTSAAIAAIYYAVNNGANVINNSWGGSGYSESLHAAVAYSYENGVAFTAAAGNAGANNDGAPLYPASYNVPHVMSIAATTSLDDLASFSNFGKVTVDLGSPGLFIMSTWPCSGGSCGHSSSSGTSMAAPLVAGIAAMMLIEAPTMLGYQIKSILFDEADYISSLTNKIATDSRINGSSSVNFSKTAVIDTEQPEYTFVPLRSLSSSESVGGCGLVKKMYESKKPPQVGRGGARSPIGISWSLLIIISIFAAPFVVASVMRSQSTQAEQTENRRKHERFSIESSVSLNVNGEKVKGSISCISAGGVQISTGALLEKGGVVKMVISSPDGSEQIEVAGQIVWEKDKESYGVQFKNVQDAVSSQINTWTETLEPETNES